MCSNSLCYASVNTYKTGLVASNIYEHLQDVGNWINLLQTGDFSVISYIFDELLNENKLYGIINVFDELIIQLVNLCSTDDAICKEKGVDGVDVAELSRKVVTNIFMVGYNEETSVRSFLYQKLCKYESENIDLYLSILKIILDSSSRIQHFFVSDGLIERMLEMNINDIPINRWGTYGGIVKVFLSNASGSSEAQKISIVQKFVEIISSDTYNDDLINEIISGCYYLTIDDENTDIYINIMQYIYNIYHKVPSEAKCLCLYSFAKALVIGVQPYTDIVQSFFDINVFLLELQNEMNIIRNYAITGIYLLIHDELCFEKLINQNIVKLLINKFEGETIKIKIMCLEILLVVFKQRAILLLNDEFFGLMYDLIGYNNTEYNVYVRKFYDILKHIDTIDSANEITKLIQAIEESDVLFD